MTHRRTVTSDNIKIGEKLRNIIEVKNKINIFKIKKRMIDTMEGKT